MTTRDTRRPKTKRSTIPEKALVDVRSKSASIVDRDWYDTPRWYDIVFDADTRLEADFLEAVWRRHGPGRKAACARGSSPGGLRVLEPACGSGRLVCEMARRGHVVTGFDLSRPMLDFARAKLRRRKLVANLSVGDMADVRVRGRFELAHCLVSTFKYLLDEKSARAHLAGVARALVPGGLYVLGFHLSDYEQRGTIQERWVEERRGTKVTCTTRVWPPNRRTRLEDVRTRLVVESTSGVRRTETRWRFRTYDARQAQRLIASVPALELVALHDFRYDAEVERTIDDGLLDCVFVLRARTGRRGRINP